MSETSREENMVVIARDDNGTPTVWCDPEIADIVAALNAAGFVTVASCSGHGHRPGRISLADGREIILPRHVMDMRRIDALFLTDINGEAAPPVDETDRLRDMSEAPKDGRYILAQYKSLDGYAESFDGRAFVVRHEGTTPSGLDLGWGLFPGHGGVPDKCFFGWLPLPAALADRTQEGEARP